MVSDDNIEVVDRLIKISETNVKILSYLKESKFNYRLLDFSNLGISSTSLACYSGGDEFHFYVNTSLFPTEICISSCSIQSKIITSEFLPEIIDEKIEMILKYHQTAHDRSTDLENVLEKSINENMHEFCKSKNMSKIDNTLKVLIREIPLRLTDSNEIKTTAKMYVTAYEKKKIGRFLYMVDFIFNANKNTFEFSPDFNILEAKEVEYQSIVEM